MKQLLLMIAVVALVGCGESKEAQGPSQPEPATPPKASPTKLIADPIVEKEVRWWLEKPEGELTEADLAKVNFLEFYRVGSNQITGGGRHIPDGPICLGTSTSIAGRIRNSNPLKGGVVTQYLRMGGMGIMPDHRRVSRISGSDFSKSH